MSVSQVPLRPLKRGALAKLWLGLLLWIGAAVLLAWTGAGAMRGETTANGVTVRTVKAGEGPFIKAVDGVLIEYEGRLDNGTVFDSSRGQPVPMIAGQVIPGFAEALQKMQKGGRYAIHIPAALAYGASPPEGSQIPANAPLNFDVSIVQIVPNAALMMPQQQGGGGGDGQPGL
jgi:FKBP-type peptidyl-prolyl cis-trans isomerase FkpA